ncbi:MAG: hypothetical protein ACPGIC_02755 [Opitutales bacterium]
MRAHFVNRHFKTLPYVRGLLVLLSMVTAVAAYCLLSMDAIKWMVQYGAYWIGLTLMITFVVYALLDLRGGGAAPFKLTSWHYLALLTAAYILFVHADYGNKVTMDDAILSASAMSLYEKQEYVVSTQGYWESEEFKLSSGYVDKRPWLYSTVVAVVHCLSGWRLENAYIVNTFLTVGLLLILTVIGTHELGLKGSWVAVLCMATLPLIAQNATGGGMDLLNLTLLTAAIYLGGRYLAEPDRSREGVFVAAVLCLAYSRYESVLYLGPASWILCLGWLKAGRVFLSSATVLSPLLLLPALLHNKLFRSSGFLWELPHGLERAFGIENLVSNFGPAVYFLFNLSGALANSALLSVLGSVALVFFFVTALRMLPVLWEKNPQQLSVLFFGIGILVNFLILLSYHDGQLDRIFASRLALPLYLLLVLSVVCMLPRLTLSAGHWRALFIIISMYILGWTLPHNSRELFTKRNYVQNELDWLVGTIGPELGPDDLVVDQKSTVWTLEKIAALRPYPFFQHLSDLEHRLNSGRYANIYFIERFEYELSDGSFSLQQVNYPESSLTLKTLAERSFRPFSLLRVSRVESIQPDRLPEGFPGSTPPRGHVADYTFNGL